MKRLVLLAVVVAALALPALAAAHPLGNFTDQPLQPRSRSPGTRRLRPLRAGHGRDPDLPGRTHRRARLRAADRTERAPRRRRAAGVARPGDDCARAPTRRRRACTRRGSRSSSRGPRLARARLGRLPRRRTTRDRIGWKEIVVGRRHAQHERRAPRATRRTLLQSPLDASSVTTSLEPATGRTSRRRCRAATASRRPTGSPTPASPRSSAART